VEISSLAEWLFLISSQLSKFHSQMSFKHWRI